VQRDERVYVVRVECGGGSIEYVRRDARNFVQTIAPFGQ